MLLAISRLIFVVGLLAVVPAAQAATQAQTLLEEGWEGTPEALTAAERRYESLSNAAKLDAEVDYAMALVRLKYRKYELALEALDSCTARSPGHLPAWRAKFWLMVFLRKHDAAVAQMQALANIYPSTAKSESVEAELIETARWMGRVHGHLTWAASGTRLPMDQHTRILTAKLSGDRLTAFEEGRDEVRSGVDRLQADFKKIQEEDAEDEQKRRDILTESIKKERDRIQTERDALEVEYAESKAKANTLVDEVNSKLKPLEKELGDLNRQAQPIRDRIRDYEQRAIRKDNDARSDDAAARNEKDANRKRNYERDADRARDEAKRLRDDARAEDRRLDPISRDIAKVTRAGTELTNERNKIVGAFNAYEAGVGQKLKGLSRDEKTVEKSEKSLTGAAAPTPRQTSMQSKIAAVSTYLKFPLEEERARVGK